METIKKFLKGTEEFVDETRECLGYILEIGFPDLERIWTGELRLSNTPFNSQLLNHRELFIKPFFIFRFEKTKGAESVMFQIIYINELVKIDPFFDLFLRAKRVPLDLIALIVGLLYMLHLGYNCNFDSEVRTDLGWSFIAKNYDFIAQLYGDYFVKNN